MILAFTLRLVCVSLASFFLLHLALGALVSLLTQPALRFAATLRPQTAAGFLLTLRLLPSALAAGLLALLCIPSYLLLEPPSALEEISPACALAAVLALLVMAPALLRAVHGMAASRRFSSRCLRHGRPLAGAEVLLLDRQSPLLALVGVWRPRVVLSEALRKALSPEQLALSLEHEQAHARSRDNLKRLLFLLAPGFAPFPSGARALEQAWAKFAEWAADDHAVAGDPRRALLLAESLIHAARLGGAPNLPAAASSLLAEAGQLSQRIDRLLSVPNRIGPSPAHASLPLSATLLAVLLAAALCRLETFTAVHNLLEHLIR